MPIKPLPSSPSLDHFKHQARDLRDAVRERQPQAAQRIREFHPRRAGLSDADVFVAPLPLADAQLTIAREYGFASWPKLKAAMSTDVAQKAALPHHERIDDPLFRRAVDLMDTGEVEGLRCLLAEHPDLVHERVAFGTRDYFGRPTLLEFLPENPIRYGRMPENVLDVLELLLESGASQDREALDRTLTLAASGCVARQVGRQIPIIDRLCAAGADPNSAISAALVHGEFAAVEALLRHGATMDLATAAALGRTDEFRALLPKASDDERQRSLAFGSQFGRTEFVEALLNAGVDPNRFNPPGMHSHSTPLHQAALAGHLDTVKVLVAHGANPAITDTLFGGTPLGWAEHGGQVAVADYLRSL